MKDYFMKRKSIKIIIVGILVCFGLLATLIYNGIIQINGLAILKYEVRGVDVSHYQGEVDWDLIESQGIRFAFIKATEGSSFEDVYFDKNWAEASDTSLRIGAYHFFSFETGGQTQAENFINKVYAVPNMLPPVVDVEPYGIYSGSSMIDQAVLDELSVWLQIVEASYEMSPIIYTTEEYYEQLHEILPQYDIWIRSVYSEPRSGISWSIWQYSNRMRLNGYSGSEKYIDMNVYNGTLEDFANYGK